MRAVIDTRIIKTARITALDIDFDAANGIDGVFEGSVINQSVVIDGDAEILVDNLLQLTHATVRIARLAEVIALAVHIGGIDFLMPGAIDINPQIARHAEHKHLIVSGVNTQYHD